MKKILLASTALVGFAGAAAAEVSLSGYAEMGILSGDTATATTGTGETQFHSDVVINFNFSGSTDNGLEFGGKVQLDDTNGSTAINGTPTFDDEAFWVSGAFGKVTLGETDGAYDWALAEIYMGTSINDDHSTHAGAYWFTGLDASYDNQVMRYEYSFGDFAAAVSAEIDDTGVGDPVIGIGVKWSGDIAGTSANAAIGYQTVDTTGTNRQDEWGISAGADLTGGFSVKLGYADRDNGTGTDFTWWGVGLGYTMDALTIQANYGEYDFAGLPNDPSGWGLVVNYDLGGGAVAMLGYGSSDNGVSGNGQGDSTWSAGLGLSF